MMSWTNCVWTSWWRGWAPTYEHNWIRSWSFKANIYIVYFSRNFNCFDCITHANTMYVASVSLMHDLREFYELRWVFSDPKRPTHVICITSHIKKCTSFFGVFRPIWGAWIICFFRKETAKECGPAIKLPALAALHVKMIEKALHCGSVLVGLDWRPRLSARNQLLLSASCRLQAGSTLQPGSRWRRVTVGRRSPICQHLAHTGLHFGKT